MSPRAPIIAGKTVILVQAQDTVDRTLESVKTKFRKFGTSIGNLSIDLFRGGLFGSIPVGLLTKQFKDFEDKILFLSTKLTASEREFNQLEQTIRNLGKSTSFTASEVADGATVLAQAGLTAKEVMDTLQPTLDLARGAQITLSQSGEILANTMRSFGMETSNANVVASQFIAAARLGTLDVLDLKESIKEVLGTVRNLNIDLPTTLALLTQMASRSLKGTKAGTSLNTALLQLASKSEVLKKNLGIDLGDNINGDQFITFLEALYDKLSKLGNLRRTAVLQSLFNIRGARAITALDEIKQIIDLRKAIASAGNEARSAAVKMDSGFGGSLRRATSAVNDLSISLGKLLAGPIGQFLEQVPQITIGIEALAREAPMLTLSLLAIPPAMLAIGAAGLTLSFVLGKLSSIAAGLLGIFRPVSGFLNKVFTAHLIGAYKATRLLRNGMRGIDRGLSSMFLTPERHTRGRLGGQIRPSSFFGRVGPTGLGSGSLGALFATGRRLDNSFTRLSRALVKPLADAVGNGILHSLTTMRRRARMSARESARRAKYAGTSGLFNDAAFAVKQRDLLTAEYRRSITAERAARAATKKYEAAALDAVAVHDRHTNLQRQLAHTTASLAKAQRGGQVPENALEAILGKRGRMEQRALVQALAAKRAEILSQLNKLGTLPDVENLVGKADLHSSLALSEKERRRQILRPRIEAARAKVVDATFKAEKAFLKQTLRANKAAKVGKLSFRVGESVKGFMGSIGNLFGKGAGATGRGLLSAGKGIGGLFSAGFRALGRVDIVKTLHTVFTFTGRIALGFLRAARSVTRFVFSFNGLMTIIDLLLLFGHKIDFIRNGFDRLGRGIKNAFGQIGSIFSLIGSGPAGLFGAGFGQILSGNASEGISSITKSLSAMANIVSSQLAAAWHTLVEAIAPAYDFMRKLISSTIELGKLLLSTFATAGSQLGNLFKLVGSTSGEAGSGINGIISSIFNPENIKTVFVGIGAVITGMAQTVTSGINRMVTVVLDTMIMLQEAIQVFTEGSPMMKGFLAGLGPMGAMLSISGQNLGPRIQQNRMLKGSLEKDLQNSLDSIQTRFEDFNKNLDKIFSKDTEKEARAKKFIAMQEAMGEAWLASLELTGEGITDVYEQIKHAQLFPKTSIFASRFGNGNIIGNTPRGNGPLSNFAAHAAGVGIGGRVGKPIPVVPTKPNGAVDKPKPQPTVSDLLKSSEVKFAKARGNVFALEEELAKNPNTDFADNIRKDISAQRKIMREEQRKTSFLERQQKVQEKLQKLAAKGLAPRLAQMGDIRDVVAASVGDIQSSRYNKFKAIGKDVQQDQLDTLNNIATGLGVANGGNDPYLRQLLNKAQPLVLQ